MPPVGPTAAVVAYETTSEGTPISPPFPNTPEGRLELVRYCASHANTHGAATAEVEAWGATRPLRYHPRMNLDPCESGDGGFLRSEDAGGWGSENRRAVGELR